MINELLWPLEIFITTFVLKFLVAIADTPFLYWARRIHPMPDTPDE